MRIVVDANVLCAALLAKGKTAELLFSDQIEPIAPELLFTELERNREELLEKTKLSENDFNILIALFRKRIRIIPAIEFADKLIEANQLLKNHKKDTEFVALALKLHCPLWSKEKRLKKINGILVLDANDITGRFFPASSKDGTI
ncbi:PIN domain-containing protein [Candidatus Woesearchaeota archaeon]|nr:PIN domain-containing protein [Candidatus Woesearchaeota archaeon]